MTFLYAALATLIICAISCVFVFFDEDDKDTVIRMISKFSIICMISLSIIFIIFSTVKPTAMDVYQGKTTLEITYKDGAPVDSVVVWKGDENDNTK